MQISPEHGFSFLCTPKCASTSIEQALEPHCQISVSSPPRVKHTAARRYHRVVVPMLDNLWKDVTFETVCVIRNPLTWIESWYRYRQRRGVVSKAKSTAGISYDEFVEAYTSEGERPAYAKLGSPYRFVSLSDDGFGVDLIFDLKRLDFFAEHMSQKIGVKIDIKRANVSPSSKVKLDRGMEARLRRYLERDIDLYQRVSESGCFDTRSV